MVSLELRALSAELIPDLPRAEEPSRGGESAPTPAPGPAPRESAQQYLVIVDRSDASLYAYLRRRFERDAKVVVLADRRRGDSQSRGRLERRSRTVRDALAGQKVVVVRRQSGATPAIRSAHLNAHDGGKRNRMEDTEILGDRQRVNRWLEESQYLIGRIIPSLLDDRERLRGKLEVAEQDQERLRVEIAELKREIGTLQSEIQYFRGEHASIAETFMGIIDHLSQLQKPLSEISRRLQAPHAMSDVKVG